MFLVYITEIMGVGNHEELMKVASFYANLNKALVL